ncbi:nuclear transport factor 2 family protein [Amycolatopsis thermophila]|uniref:SnoaL-like domain-containing protein n=1 Tax=Amycolatopsis thermophila TaxID=206084 RepID=A0ABU0F198_9PSEU|nr:nuclear transport factor 2 family protein [Amycolatopsis thermophila]MDQ0381346.1 hypothetical protein [Amycolatopsis thermophila]
MTAQPQPGWGRATGHVTLPPAEPGGEALDRFLIAERVARYGWAFDERDRSALAACFTPDATWQGLVMGRDPIGPFRGADAIADWLAGFWDSQPDQRRHVFTNVVVGQREPGRATAHAYLVLLSSQDAATRVASAGPYRFDLHRTGGQWLITELRAGFDAPF